MKVHKHGPVFGCHGSKANLVLIRDKGFRLYIPRMSGGIMRHDSAIACSPGHGVRMKEIDLAVLARSVLEHVV